MPSLESFTSVEAYSNQIEIPGIASIIHEDSNNQATYGNHCELSSTTILAVYNDVTNSKGMLKIGTRVSDFAIEWGTAVEFNNDKVGYIIPVRVSDTKFLIVYQDFRAGTYKGVAISGTVSGTIPTLGGKLDFVASSTATPIGAVLMDTDKVMIAFANSSTNGQAVIASLTGTTISYGVVATFVATGIINSGQTTLTQLCKHSTTLASVVYYVSTTVSEVVTLSLSGTTITPNTAGKVSYSGGGTTIFPSIGALDATKFVVAYTYTSIGNVGKAEIGTISGTTITLGGAYTFDVYDSATRIPILAIISSTLFAVVYGTASTNINAIVGSVSGTTITLGTALQISGVYSDSSYNLYPPKGSAYTVIKLTLTKIGQLTFSYPSYYNNQFVCGMLTQNYRTLEVVPMCHKVVEAGVGEQIELSSVYLKGNNNGFTISSSILNYLTPSLYHNGTLSGNEFYTVPNDIGIASSYSQVPIKTLELDKANNPIILTEGQSLYASINSNQGTSSKKGSCTVFGLKRSV